MCVLLTGITSGKAYCGEVGSPLRHEYAVMGPSTNLSARLMGKAKPGKYLYMYILYIYLYMSSCCCYFNMLSTYNLF